MSVELPPAHGVVVPGDELEAIVAIIGKQAQILHCPVGAIVDRDFVLAVTVEIADEQLVAGLELPGSRHPIYSAENEIELGAIRAKEHDGVAIVHQQIIPAIAIEVSRKGL